MSAGERVIVALDVPTIAEALGLVERLDNISFFKVGWQLFMTGEVRQLLDRLRDKQVFLDLKVPGDIGNTLSAVVDQCVSMGVRFLTISESVPRPMLEAAARARKGSPTPKLLVVPFLSSMGQADLATVAAGAQTVNEFIVARAKAFLDAGCDGVIASGDAIGVCRQAFPSALIVSPGIRPSGSSTDDHKRSTTPGEAIGMGADYLVVGRPICGAPDPRDAAARVIAEVAAAEARQPRAAPLPAGTPAS